MSRELRRVLFELRDQRLLQTFSRGEESIEGELVFPSEVGAVLDINNLVPRHFLPLLERAGLRRIRFHDLRQLRQSAHKRRGSAHLCPRPEGSFQYQDQSIRTVI